MQKRKITLPDGRYLIFYIFPEEEPPRGQEKSKEQGDPQTEAAEADSE